MAGKLKKLLKKVGKIALPVGAALLAAKFGRKKGLKGADVEGARGFNLRRKLRGVGRQSEGMDLSGAKFRGGLLPEGFEETETWAAKGGRVGAKHGGKVKSMGVAKRGGGVAIK